MTLTRKHVAQSENLRPVSDQKIARAALTFVESIEAGTAIIPLPRGGGTAFGHGDKIVYRAIAGDAYDAVIAAVRGPELVDIDVIVPGCADPVHLTRIRFQAREAT